jgi:DDE superfamily endonuclease
VRCCDAMPYQRLADVRAPLPAAPGNARREDYEYERTGTCHVLLACEPWTGRRHVTVTETRKHPDFAQAMQELAETHYPTAKELRIVLDNLRTQTPAAFYQTLAPEVARELTRKIAFHSPPKHGSGLNRAEGEFAVLSRQCLPQRLPTQARVPDVVQRWASTRTAKQIPLHWQCTTEKARDKFQRFSPHSSLWSRTSTPSR